MKLLSIPFAKVILVTVATAGLTCSAQATDRVSLEKRLRSITVKFQELQAKPDKCVPPDMLRRAWGVILLESAKGGLGIGYRGGAGVTMVKDPDSGRWSPPAFMRANEGSLGLQIGGQTSFSVVLLMDTNSAFTLTASTFDFGGEAGGTAGTASGYQEGSAAVVEPWTQVYADSAGLYGGAVVKGGSLSPDTKANLIYYGTYLTPREILFGHKGQPTEAAVALADELSRVSNGPVGSR
jgi:SH3 domain-containing YSC84-like protein 1